MSSKFILSFVYKNGENIYRFKLFVFKNTVFKISMLFKLMWIYYWNNKMVLQVPRITNDFNHLPLKAEVLPFAIPCFTCIAILPHLSKIKRCKFVICSMWGVLGLFLVKKIWIYSRLRIISLIIPWGEFVGFHTYSKINTE